jgi:SpoVK/Ycf46/Vps4 family AAA+-type ATPase
MTTIFKFHRALLIFFAVLGSGTAAYAYLNPGVAACSVSKNNQVRSAIHDQLVTDSRARIQQTFGSLQSKPLVVFFDEPDTFWPFRPNEYGSTNFIGSKVCVIVGSKGQNIDVLSHELMHAEIADRVGYWRRFTQLPVWFDEGLAMQVDYRPDYNLPESASSKADDVKSLRTASDFFAANDATLTKNYASAKVVVKKWVADIGFANVYSQLDRVRAGESFESMINRK